MIMKANNEIVMNIIFITLSLRHTFLIFIIKNYLRKLDYSSSDDNETVMILVSLHSFIKKPRYSLMSLCFIILSSPLCVSYK